MADVEDEVQLAAREDGAVWWHVLHDGAPRCNPHKRIAPTTVRPAAEFTAKSARCLRPGCAAWWPEETSTT